VDVGIAQLLDTTAKFQALQMEREDNRHRQLIDSIAQIVENKARRDSWISDIAYSEAGGFCFKEAAGRVS
jgi:hypothetical protein